MKLTEEKLRQLVREELANLNEAADLPGVARRLDSKLLRYLDQVDDELAQAIGDVSGAKQDRRDDRTLREVSDELHEAKNKLGEARRLVVKAITELKRY